MPGLRQTPASCLRFFSGSFKYDNKVDKWLCCCNTVLILAPTFLFIQKKSRVRGLFCGLFVVVSVVDFVVVYMVVFIVVFVVVFVVVEVDVGGKFFVVVLSLSSLS